MIRHYDVADQLLTAEEIKAARFQLGFTVRGMAEILLLSPRTGGDRVLAWEEGRMPITGPASQAIRLWLAVRGFAPIPAVPLDRDRRLARARERARGEFPPREIPGRDSNSWPEEIVIAS